MALCYDAGAQLPLERTNCFGSVRRASALSGRSLKCPHLGGPRGVKLEHPGVDSPVSAPGNFMFISLDISLCRAKAITSSFFAEKLGGLGCKSYRVQLTP